MTRFFLSLTVIYIEQSMIVTMVTKKKLIVDWWKMIFSEILFCVFSKVCQHTYRKCVLLWTLNFMVQLHLQNPWNCYYRNYAYTVITMLTFKDTQPCVNPHLQKCHIKKHWLYCRFRHECIRGEKWMIVLIFLSRIKDGGVIVLQ